MYKWTIDDLFDALEILDEKEEAEAKKLKGV
jgi:hypothetical protein